ncbi:hypothetical protein BUALT_Bualt09G0052300 [Buddleja alternifolia]|uniref:FLZ-type domain-containing protein n=1 Tax=Buddleja alternifolia TaxID=168488 RepID=A0AAV6X1D1_9LAMI|nr:hypothetical protein BUALT_Bualt09G0052300 [Buddleja alternifolia]
MAEMEWNKKKLYINLSFLNLTDSTKAQKSAKSFEEPNGVVGLGILAALTDAHRRDSISPSSKPIQIISNKNFSENNSSNKKLEEMELCEEYTCVISHVGENIVKKREYFEADGSVSVVTGNYGGFEAVSDSSLSCGGGGGGGGEAAIFTIADFLSSCFLCQKMLHGLDIFMYRGEKAFCSTECRHRQISIDEKKEMRRSGVRKQKEYSVSPCSGTSQFLAGVAAA